MESIGSCVECEIIEVDDRYVLSCEDYSLEGLDVSLHSKHTVLITQTGCVYDCAFCGYKDKYKEHRLFDLSEIKKTLAKINGTNMRGLNHIRFADETFNVDNSRVIELCNFIQSQDFNFRWSCFLRADNISTDLINALSRAKYDFVSIGVESGSVFMQTIMNKNINLDKLRKAILELMSSGIIVNISLMVGFLGETELMIEATMNYVSLCKADLARVNMWIPAQNEKNRSLFESYGFRYIDNTWSHDSLSEVDAANYAKKIYLMNSDTVFIPPFSSIFDQWPVLASYELTKEEIIKIFTDYYNESKKVAKSK